MKSNENKSAGSKTYILVDRTINEGVPGGSLEYFVQKPCANWSKTGPVWTTDRSKAFGFQTRQEAENVAGEWSHSSVVEEAK